MPTEYVIDKAQKTVFTTLYGTLTLKEGVEHHHRLASDPDFDISYNELIDGGALEKVGLNTSGIFSLSQSCPFGPTARRAIYSTDRQLYYGFARMFQTLAGGKHGEIEVFKERDEALQWLGVEMPDSDSNDPSANGPS